MAKTLSKAEIWREYKQAKLFQGEYWLLGEEEPSEEFLEYHFGMSLEEFIDPENVQPPSIEVHSHKTPKTRRSRLSNQVPQKKVRQVISSCCSDFTYIFSI